MCLCNMIFDWLIKIELGYVKVAKKTSKKYIWQKNYHYNIVFFYLRVYKIIEYLIVLNELTLH